MICKSLHSLSMWKVKGCIKKIKIKCSKLIMLVRTRIYSNVSHFASSELDDCLDPTHETLTFVSYGSLRVEEKYPTLQMPSFSR